MVVQLTIEQRSALMARIRGKDTRPELVVRNPGLSLSPMAEKLGWTNGKSQYAKSWVQRVLDRLKKEA
jgi:hypothetical protein